MEVLVTSVGVLPLVAFSIPLLGTQLCSLPFCDLGGILSDNEQVSVALLQHLKQFMSDQRVKSADLRHTEHVASEAAQPGEKVRMVLPLEASAVVLLRGAAARRGAAPGWCGMKMALERELAPISFIR